MPNYHQNNRPLSNNTFTCAKWLPTNIFSLPSLSHDIMNNSNVVNKSHLNRAFTSVNFVINSNKK